MEESFLCHLTTFLHYIETERHGSYSGGPGVKISARRPAALTEVFRGFPHSLQANTGILLLLLLLLFTGAYSPGRTFGLPFRGFLITHTVGLLWMSDQPVAETFTYTGQHNI
jgi:hypothetical protein